VAEVACALAASKNSATSDEPTYTTSPDGIRQTSSPICPTWVRIVSSRSGPTIPAGTRASHLGEPPRRLKPRNSAGAASNFQTTNRSEVFMEARSSPVIVTYLLTDVFDAHRKPAPGQYDSPRHGAEKEANAGESSILSYGLRAAQRSSSPIPTTSCHLLSLGLNSLVTFLITVNRNENTFSDKSVAPG